MIYSMNDELKQNILKDLNEEQTEAVKNIDCSVLILAGAGTGKTKTLVHRTAYMLASGISAKNILLLTFTNKAANEMKQRISDYVDSDEANKITASTFHSFCSRFLRANATLAGFKENYTILGDGDPLDIITIFADQIKRDLKDQGLSSTEFPTARQMQSIYAECINNMRSLEDVINSLDSIKGYEKEVRSILTDFVKYKKSHNMMDYDDLIYYTVKILHNNEDVRRLTANTYKYVMCDEYQDTNKIQDDLLNLITKDHKNLAVVGDDNQSIYAFRGTKIGNILNFDKLHKNCKVIKLVKNYRSTQEILDACNAVMLQAKEGRRKDLVGFSHGDKPNISVFENSYDVAAAVVETIECYHNEFKIPYIDQAVIVRNSMQSTWIEQQLSKCKIPFEKFGGIKFFQRDMVKDLVAYLRVSTSTQDAIAWLRVLRIIRFVGKVNAKNISDDVVNEGLSALVSKKYARKGFYKDLVKLKSVIDDIKTMTPKQQIKYLLDKYYSDTYLNNLNNSNINDDRKKELNEKFKRDKQDMPILLDLADSYTSTRAFLEEIALASQNPPKDGDYVNITTIHSAKGLEYDVVFLVDPVQGQFPKTDTDCADDRESLRCLYVALTRAKRHLHIVLSKTSRFDCSINQLSHHLDDRDILDKFTYNPHDLADLSTCLNVEDENAADNENLDWDFL